MICAVYNVYNITSCLPYHRTKARPHAACHSCQVLHVKSRIYNIYNQQVAYIQGGSKSKEIVFCHNQLLHLVIQFNHPPQIVPIPEQSELPTHHCWYSHSSRPLRTSPRSRLPARPGPGRQGRSDRGRPQ